METGYRFFNTFAQSYMKKQGTLCNHNVSFANPKSIDTCTNGIRFEHDKTSRDTSIGKINKGNFSRDGIAVMIWAFYHDLQR